MAPFLTHLVVGERVWRALNGQHLRDGYGTFLFGCLAPDMDKFSDDLEQSTTHFLAKDQAFIHAWQRSRHFLDHPADFLRVPFQGLGDDEQVFVLGYLCHVTTDEMTARLGLSLRGQCAASGASLPNVDALLTSIDPRCWAMALDPDEVLMALQAAEMPVGAFPFASQACLVALYRTVLPQIQEGGGLESFLRMLRRQWQWRRHGQVRDAVDDPDLEAELAEFRGQLEAELPASERLVETLDLGVFVEEATRHSLQRIYELLAGEEFQ
jgi:hypothetical protein